MKYTLMILALISFTHLCRAQNINTEMSEEGQPAHLLGKINRSRLESPPHNTWFEKNYKAYEPNGLSIEKLRSHINDYEILLFMGTWCGDSKREVPRFFKVLDELDYPVDQLTIVAVGRSADLYKQSPQHEEAGRNIHRVPTFIIYKHGKEVNRIVEEPAVSLEKDLLSIVTDGYYESNYAIVTAIDQKLTRGVKKFKKSEEEIIKTYGDKVSSMYELNTYAKVLMHSNQKEEALAVLQMNTKLFPDNANVYLSLANYLISLGREQEGLPALEKAAELAPKNQKIKERINMLRSR